MPLILSITQCLTLCDILFSYHFTFLVHSVCVYFSQSPIYWRSDWFLNKLLRLGYIQHSFSEGTG